MRRYLKTSLVLALMGTLFAGYLSAIKLFSGTCAFNEPCPYFLGYPACWYGFVLFAAMLAASAAALLGRIDGQKCRKTLLIVSFLGILFAGRYVVQEIYGWLMQGFGSYSLGLPTCVYGLVFYIAIFVLSLKAGPKAVK